MEIVPGRINGLTIYCNNQPIKFRRAKYLYGRMLALLFLSAFVFLQISTVSAQQPEMPAVTEQQIENNAAANDDIETEDDSYLQQMQQYLKEPLDLNTADEATLKELLLLNPIQIQNLIFYRNLFGKFISIYELQAVPAWDIATIKKLQPYIIVSDKINVFASIRPRLNNGTHSILIRAAQVLERSKGYIPDSAATNNYQGSQQKLLLRYKYAYKNILQYGIVAEKDAGEAFFKGGQKQGFDYYSAHFFVRNLGVIKALALGDFTVNFGQGLTSWQSLAFKKGPDVMNLKRQGPVLRPYNSAGEINFHRGIGITLAKRNWEATLFASYKKVDANLVPDTLSSNSDFVSSLQTSGYHRTANEVADKGIQRQLAFGGNISYQYKKWHVGISAVQYRLKLPLIKGDEPYNKYALSGTSFGNYSVDYSFTRRNIHFFGEAAVTNKFDKAFINGMLISAANTVDVSLLYRNIEKSYQSLYTNAFTESTYPTNEKGLYGGISVRPFAQLRIDAYVDHFKFPWLKYRVDRPSEGSDFFVQLTYTPNKQLEIYTRYHSGAKAINLNPDDLTLPPVPLQPRQNWRINTGYKINQAITLRNRVEMVWFDKKDAVGEKGFLLYFDILFKPVLRPFSAGLRMQYFETDGYNSRLYAYENDVLYSFSIPVFYDKGYRYYFNFNYDVNKKLVFWGRVSQTLYPGKTLIGSGLDEIKGNKRTQAEVQLLYIF
jgi:hypothetical protein